MPKSTKNRAKMTQEYGKNKGIEIKSGSFLRLRKKIRSWTVAGTKIQYMPKSTKNQNDPRVWKIQKKLKQKMEHCS